MNIAVPVNIRFKTNSEGNITGMYVWGTKFNRSLVENNNDFQLIKSSDKKNQFKIPKQWTFQNNSSTISISGNNSVNTIIRTNETLETNFDDFFNQYLKQEKLIMKSETCSQTFGNQVWQQITYITQTRESRKQYIVFSTNTMKNKIFAAFSTIDGDLTHASQNYITPVIESFIIEAHL